MTARPLRIAYLAQHFVPEPGALPARVSEMAQCWMDAGHEVTVVCAVPHRPAGRIPPEYRGRLFVEELWNGARVLRSWVFTRPEAGIAATIANNVSFLFGSALQSLLSRQSWDVIIASEPPFLPHISGMAVARWKRIPVVLEIRDLWPDYVREMKLLPRPVPALLLRVEAALLKRADHVLVVSESFRRRVIDKGVSPRSVTVVSNGVNSDLYCPSAETPPIPELVRRDGEFIVGYAGNFGRGQALEQVVDAATELRARLGINARFVLVGDGPHASRVQEYAAQASQGLVVCRDSIPKSSTRAFYNNCDVVLIPHAPLNVFADTVPSKLFEVLACGRPLVASVAGEAAEIVHESGSGSVVPPGDAVALANAIARELRRSPSEAARRTASGRAFVEQHYSRSVLAARYLELLQDVVVAHTQGNRYSSRVRIDPAAAVLPLPLTEEGRVGTLGSVAARSPAGRSTIA